VVFPVEAAGQPHVTDTHTHTHTLSWTRVQEVFRHLFHPTLLRKEGCERQVPFWKDPSQCQRQTGWTHCCHVPDCWLLPQTNKMATSAVKSFQIKATIIQSLSLVKTSLYNQHTGSTILTGMNIALFLLYSMPICFKRM